MKGQAKSTSQKDCFQIFGYKQIIREIILLIFSLLIFFNPVIWAQNSDSLAYDNSKVQTLKYLKSLGNVENNKLESDTFIKKYEINIRKSNEATILTDIHIKNEPTAESPNGYILVPKGTLVRIYKLFRDDNYRAIKYKKKWGFVPESVIKKIN